MNLSTSKELSSLTRLTVDQLRSRYADLFGEPTTSRHKQWLIRRIAWQIQAAAEGGLSERARLRAAELAREADLRLSAPKSVSYAITISKPSRSDPRLPVPGTVLTRPYKGEVLQLKVLADGFEYEGEVFASLSAVANRITGTHCNGFHFFGLRGAATR